MTCSSSCLDKDRSVWSVMRWDSVIALLLALCALVGLAATIGNALGWL